MTTLLLSALGGFFLGFSVLDVLAHQGNLHPFVVLVGIFGGGLILAAWSHLGVVQ